MTGRRYGRGDFEEAWPGAGAFFCPGCNDTKDDYAIPSIGCPCDTHGTGFGSLDADGLGAYLAAGEDRES